jgi:predicted nucleic acid-binding protein
MELNNQKAVLQQILSAHLVEKEHFENYYSNQQVEEITKLSFYKNTPEKII